IKNVDKLMEWWIDYPERYNPEGKVPENIWEFPIPTQGSWGNKIDFGEEEFRHACPFPPEMMARLILLSSDKNDVVLDP
ncbi:site-specific DNA-methyltransferase, partial [Paenibacillus sp. EKM208P]